MTVSQAFSTSASTLRIGSLALRLPMAAAISRQAQTVAAPRPLHLPCLQDAIFHHPLPLQTLQAFL